MDNINAMKKPGLLMAVSEGNDSIFNDYIKNEINVNFIIKRDGLLHLASRYGHLDIVKKLFELGASCNQRYGDGNRLPLHEACMMGNVEIVALIADASKDFIDAKDVRGLTAAHICTMNGELGALKELALRGASLTAEDSDGMQLCHWAAKRNHSSIILYLFELDTNLNCLCLLGRTPIHYAAMNKSVQALECLVKCRADIAIGDKQSVTAMHLAARHGSLECLRFLASLNIPLDVRQFDGKTPAHLAALTGSYECLHWLLSNGSNIAAIDDEGNTIGHMACRCGEGEVIYCYLKHQGATTVKNNLDEDLNQIARRYCHPIKYDQAKKGEVVCPMCRLESNKNEWDQIHAPSAVVRSINKGHRSLFQSPLGSYSAIVTQHKIKYRDKTMEINRRNLETVNIGKEIPSKDAIIKKGGGGGSAYRDLITRYYGEYISNK